MSSLKKSIGVAGAGYWGKNLVRCLHEMDALGAVFDTSEAVRERLKGEYPGVTLYGSLDALLNDPHIQALVVASPAVTHFDVVKSALQAGKHVFVEKPLALNTRDGRELVKLAAARERVLFVGHILHYHAAVVRLKELIKEGKVGQLEYIYSNRLSLGKFRQEENILWSFAPHDISLILSLVGEEPSSIESVGSSFLNRDIADVTMTNFGFPSGVKAHIFVSWLNPFKEQRLVVVGSEGMLVFEDTLPLERKLIHYPHQITWEDGVPNPKKAEGIPVDVATAWVEPLKAECQAFLKAVTTGMTPVTDGREGLRVLQVLETCQAEIEKRNILT